MNIVVRRILGHTRNADGGYTLFVDAEIGGTVLGSLRLTLPGGHDPLEMLRAIVDGHDGLPHELIARELAL